MLLLLLSLIPYRLIKCFTGKLGFYLLLVKATVLSVAFTKLQYTRASRCRKTQRLSPGMVCVLYMCCSFTRAVDKNYCSLSSEILRPFIFPSAQPINKPLSRVSKTNNINDFKRENKYQRKAEF